MSRKVEKGMPSRPRSGGVPRARSLFIRRLRAMGIRDRPTAPRSPWQNRHTERLIGSMPIGAHGVNAVITARKEHVAGCDRSGDQAGKVGVDRFRGAIADHQPHTLSSPAKACDDRQDEESVGLGGVSGITLDTMAVRLSHTKIWASPIWICWRAGNP